MPNTQRGATTLLTTRLAASPSTTMASVSGTDMVTERLTAMEATQMGVGPSITTTTFLRGDPVAAAASLKARLGLVLAANPWLAGMIVKTGKHVDLVFNRTVSDDAMANIFNPAGRLGKVSKKAVAVDSTMDSSELSNRITGTAAHILAGNKSLGKLEYQTALSVIPDGKRPADTFCVVFSVGHVIADGFTYYKLLNMLSANGEISALSPTRKMAIEEQSKVAMGDEVHGWAFSGSTMCNVVCSMLCASKKALIESYYIDPERVKTAKAAVAGKTQGVEFVSTNDVLTSMWGMAVDADVVMMPLNWRNRLPDFTDSDAGNYEGTLAFGPGDFDHPGLVRKTLLSGPPTFTRAGPNAPMPKGYKNCRCRIAMMTNWAFPFFSEVVVDGCTQMVHLPHIDTGMIPFEIGVVYRPCTGRTAVTYMTRQLDSAALQESNPLGIKVTTPEAAARVV